MYLKNALTATLVSFALLSHAQEATPISIFEISVPQALSANIITEVSKNHVSSSITVHTYKLNGNPLSESQDDSGNQVAVSTSINRMINTFLSLTGVNRCTFDNVTQTFTILADASINLNEAVQLINQ